MQNAQAAPQRRAKMTNPLSANLSVSYKIPQCKLESIDNAMIL